MTVTSQRQGQQWARRCFPKGAAPEGMDQKFYRSRSIFLPGKALPAGRARQHLPTDLGLHLRYLSLTPNQIPQNHFDQGMGKAKTKESAYVLLLLKPRSFEWKPIRKPHTAKLASERCWGAIFCFKGRLQTILPHSINLFFHCFLLSLSFPSKSYW